MSTLQPDIALPIEETNQVIALPRTQRISFGTILIHGLVVFLLVIAAFFLHELSHAAAAILFGGRVVVINVLGVQWYPPIRFTPEYGFGGYVGWLIPNNLLATHLIVVAGSTGTALLALLAALTINIFRPRGLVRTALVVISFYFLDSIIHIIPVLQPGSNSAPPDVRSFPESYYALLDIGVPGEYYITAVFVTAIVVLSILAFGLYRSRKTS